MRGNPDEELVRRAQEVADVAPFVELFQDIADDVDGWWADGMPEEEIDRRVLAALEELGWSDIWTEEMAPQLTWISPDKLKEAYHALRFDQWAVECVKNVAKTGRSLPFPYVVGDAWVDHSLGEPVVWAWATPATDPSVVANKFVYLCREQFGDQAFKDPRARADVDDALGRTQLMAMKRSGMSYTEIALEMVRRRHPDESIEQIEKTRRQELKRERNRVIKDIQAGEKVWRQRLPEDSTAE